MSENKLPLCLNCGESLSGHFCSTCGQRDIVAPVGIVVLLTIPIYATMAFRRVYGGGIGITLVKEIGISFLYLIVSIFAMLGLVYWVSIF